MMFYPLKSFNFILYIWVLTDLDYLQYSYILDNPVCKVGIKYFQRIAGAIGKSGFFKALCSTKFGLVHKTRVHSKVDFEFV